jgi:hypothetical protein
MLKKQQYRRFLRDNPRTKEPRIETLHVNRPCHLKRIQTLLLFSVRPSILIAIKSFFLELLNGTMQLYAGLKCSF